MTSTNHIQNGTANETVQNKNNNLRKSINLHQQQQFYETTNLLNGFTVGSSTSSTSSNSIEYATVRKYNGYDIDEDNDDDNGYGNVGGGGRVSIKRNDLRENTIGSGGVGLDLNRKIKLSGGNELRIDEKNISLHLNNPFVTNYMIKEQSTNTAASITQSTSSPQISSNHHHRQQLHQMPTNNENTINKFGNGMNSVNELSMQANHNNSTTYRPKRPHSIAGVSSSMLTMKMTGNANSEQKTFGGGGIASATTTMTYSSNTRNRTTNFAQSNENVKQSLELNNEATSSPSTSASYTAAAQRQLSFSQFVNSPSRLITNRNLQELSLYTPPASSTALDSSIQQSSQYQQQRTQKIPPSVVPRRSHSTPRPIQTLQNQQQQHTLSLNGAANPNIPQRPRSLDRATINTLGLSNGRPPPIPPSRRFSQPIHSTGNNQTTLKLSVNSTTSPSQQRTTASGVLQPGSSISGMRQSATFHGQLNRHANVYAKSDNDSMGTIRRKTDRPLSYAYGTLPDQAFLENQLRIYSEQLRTITESVRKYSEQAKLLSEMKRQQQVQQQKRTFELQTQSPVTKRQSDSNIYGNSEYDEPQTPSHQLKLFLDSIRSTMKDDNIESEHPQQQQLPPQKLEQISSKAPVTSTTTNTNTTEPKTPSDQLRQFLDAIRSNQLPEESADDIANAAQRFSKFKEKLENSRSKSTPSFDKFQQSPVISESFNQFSDNLRIMNEDLEALAAIKTPKKSASGAANEHKKSSYVNCDNSNVSVHNRMNGGTLVNSTSNNSLNNTNNNNNTCNVNKNVMDFNQILDSFTQLTNSSHSMDAIDYLRKCSEALRQTSEQLRMAQMHSNQSYDSAESSSCSTTPGSIREAVQNLLQQPRNGFQIMDDRMKLFIDILDSQSKFSQVGILGVKFACFRLFYVSKCFKYVISKYVNVDYININFKRKGFKDHV